MNTPTPRVLHHGEFLDLIREAHWEYSNRHNASGAAIILAVTPERKVLLVEQYRIPVHARTIEMPAGIIGDEPGHEAESFAAAARRELREETGYDAARVERLTAGASCAGITSEVVTLFLATELTRVGVGGGVAQEAITVHEVPLGDIDVWLTAKSKTGVLVDPKVYAGLYFLTRNA
jgi:ADP-ribose pyrophosphatase